MESRQTGRFFWRDNDVWPSAQHWPFRIFLLYIWCQLKTSASDLKPPWTHWDWNTMEYGSQHYRSSIVFTDYVALGSQFCHFSKKFGVILIITWRGRREIRRKTGLLHVQWPGKYCRWLKPWRIMKNGGARTTAPQLTCSAPIFIPAAIHGCVMLASNGGMKVTQSSRLSENKGKWHYHSIQVKAGGRGAWLIWRGKGLGGEHQLHGWGGGPLRT